MIRIIAAFCAAFALVLVTTLACGSVIRERQAYQQHSQLQHRISELDGAVARWTEMHNEQGVAARASRDEALRTLALLQRLYEQEERLWSYYDVVERSHETRTELTESKLAYLERIRQQERELEALEEHVNRLRPRSETGITFQPQH